MANKVKGSRPSWHQRVTSLILIFLNILILSGVFMLYTQYNSAYKERLYEENLGNIANLNQSAVENTTALFESWRIKLDDIVSYVKYNNMNLDETLEMISNSNSSDERYFELIGSDYKGYLAKKSADGTYPELDYSHHSYSALQNAFDSNDNEIPGSMNFTPEYTDAGETAEKFFAVYKHMTLENESGIQEKYTLLLAVNAKSIIKTLNIQADYVGQSTILMDSSGNYIVSSNNYKSTNFFQFLYSYNDLTLDERTLIQHEMSEKGSGELYYKNAATKVEDCVYRYERMGDDGWFCVTCVPLSSFSEPSFNTSYIIYAIVFIIFLFALDIIWLQNMNRRLRISVERERIANSSKSSFLSRMSHEIRTPLNAVIGYNTIAKKELTAAQTEAEHKDAEMKVMDCLSKSEIASKHLLTVINDVLDMSAIESGKIKIASERFDFRGLITSLTTVFYSQAKAKGVSFEVVFNSPTEEWFIGDQMRVSQILTNLLSNAVKFTSDGGSVKLSITQSNTDNNTSNIHFEISDTGIGMTQEYLGHIFTPFEQADSSISRRFGGSGLGLSITKNLIDLMNGTISVTSTLGVGTNFCVDISFVRTEQPQNGVEYDFSSVNALVVDDDISTCNYINLLFDRCGAKCTAVYSGEEALVAMSAAINSNNAYTICIVDWKMPKMDGVETIRELRKIVGNNIPIIVLTAYDYSEIADIAAQIGVNRFISKPLFHSSLYDLLATICEIKPVSKPSPYKSVDFGGARILLAEDNAMNMEIATNILESAGLVVDSAWNGLEAVKLFTASEPGYYKMIFMDVHMPEMNGHDATRAIRTSLHKEAATIPIVAMTADAFEKNVAEAIEAGMNEHVAKPIDIPALFNILHKYIT